MHRLNICNMKVKYNICIESVLEMLKEGGRDGQNGDMCISEVLDSLGLKRRIIIHRPSCTALV